MLKLSKYPPRGFTLIELLVVVLIIGILAAIALPQYKKVVLKSRYAAIKDKTRAIYDAEQRYYLLHNSFTGSLAVLDIDIPSSDCVVDPNNYVICSLRNQAGEYVLQYILTLPGGVIRCDAFPGDINSLSNKICQEDLGKTSPNYCSSFCAYY